MGMYKVVKSDNVPRFKAKTFLGSKLWNIETPYLRFKYKMVLVNFRPGLEFTNAFMYLNLKYGIFNIP